MAPTVVCLLLGHKTMPFAGDTVDGVASVESPLLETMNGRGAEVEVQKKRY
jgi:hypothetical protein